MSDELRLEEQALSHATEMTIEAKLDQVENVDVDIRTNLLKMAQGQVDSVSVAAQGLVMQKDLRVQEMELHTHSIAVDLLRAVFGEIELDKPIDATARVVLTEQDINYALNADSIRSKFQRLSLELNLDGQVMTLIPQQLKVDLPGEGKIGVSGTIALHEMSQTRCVGFSAVIRPRTFSQPLLVEAFQCTKGDGISLELAIAFLEKARELVNLSYFELEGTALRIKELEVKKGSIMLQTEAHIKQLPDLNLEQ